MIFLAGFILKGPFQAALVVSAMAILGLLFPPVTWISAASIVLVTLAKGYKQGLLTTAIAYIGAVIFAYIILLNIANSSNFSPIAALEMVFYFVLLVWLPAWIAATALKFTVSLAYSLQLLVIIGLIAVVVFYMLYPDFGELWRTYFDQLFNQLATQSDKLSSTTLQSMENGLIHFLPGLFVSSLLFGTMLSLFLGRWWQAVYFNPGGFAKEFQSLSLGKASAIAALSIIVLSLLMKTYVMYSLSAIVLLLYFIQGIAILHAVFRIRQLHTLWLVLTYVLMMFIPEVMLLLIFAGLVDNWLDIRHRLVLKDLK